MNDSMNNNDTRAGFVALIGAPNAGKSTLMNQLVGAKVSIVTHKVQTTRSVVRGILIHGTSQIIFVDTPGIFKPRRRLDQAMVTTAWSSSSDADITVLLVDAERGLTEDIEEIIASLNTGKPDTCLLINKIDLVPRGSLLELSSGLNALYPFTETFMVSAKTGDGCVGFLDYLANAVPEGPWLFPEEQISDMPMRLLAAEVTREKLFLRLHQELPYASHVETESWKDQKDGSVRIEQVIYVERDSQKKIVIGKKGATIKAISTAARKEISDLIDQPVHLFLFVKVRENWGNDPERYRELGLQMPGR